MMPIPESEKHPKWDWEKTNQIYRCEGYAAIWGIYKDDPSGHKQLGVRWTGECDTINFPYGNGGSAWFVEPDFVAQGMLCALLEDSLANPDGRGDINKILAAITELAKRTQTTSQN